ncbi:HI0074 family nucleotidyltransferase substrate-binding subunit [Candidatus Babeliales bacterium]|nr:HI0074 family nucleotidyltransferase substrate-binding subunit [Candidatus Babeliales bacterium]
MEKIKISHENLGNALKRLEKAIESFNRVREEGAEKNSLIEIEELETMSRDSLIKRFEFCLELFWKYIKKYLVYLKKPSEFNAPRSVIKTACKVEIILEQDAEKILEMIDSRNITSHIYKEEMAEIISSNIPEYYKIMLRYFEKLKLI